MHPPLPAPARLRYAGGDRRLWGAFHDGTMLRRALLRRLPLPSAALAGAVALIAGGALAQSLRDSPTVNSYGLPGLLDMPTATSFDNANVTTTVFGFDGIYHGTLSFQVLPDVTVSFRYSDLTYQTRNTAFEHWDRSFDIHWQAITEDGWWPSVAVGARDFIGTGFLSGEYVVATRHLGSRDQVAVTAGIGWGRFADRNTFTNPLGAIDPRFETRPDRTIGQGGEAELDQFFRGDAAVFAGIEWQATEDLRLQLEYSNARFVDDSLSTVDFVIDSDINLGLTYDLGQWGQVSAQYLYGNTIALRYAVAVNPTRPAVPGLIADAPIPVAARPAPPAHGYDRAWVAAPGAATTLRDAVEAALLTDGGAMTLVGLNVDADRATLRLRNLAYPQEAMALGRALRIMAATLPASVEMFEVIFVVAGLDTSRVRVARSDVERNLHQASGAGLTMALAEVEGARVVSDPATLEIAGDDASRFTWGLAPYLELSLFDPENPLLYDVGIAASARFEFGGGFVASAIAHLPVFGTLGEARIVDGVQPGGPFPVRSESALYHQASDGYIDHLTLSHYATVAPDIHTRLTFGYLERMFAGVSGEVLWHPARSDIAFGLEVNHVWRRDFDGGFGVQDYDVTTGHVSAYIDLGNDFEAQLDLGRYLAGDWGGTFALERTFDNGWRVGAFATLTDVSFEEFGEGSFDKGITLTVPLHWLTGTQTRREGGGTIRPLWRDGGARLDVDGRLYDLVSDYQRPNLVETEGTLWR